MNEVTKEYGAALFMLAQEKGSAGVYLEELEAIKKVFDETPGYMEFLSSPSIPKSERLAAISSAFENKISEDCVSFLMLLCEKNRINGFDGATEEYRKLFDISKKVKNVVVTSAVELTDDEKLSLQKKLEAKTKSIINTEYFIDKSLLGGMIVEIEGKILDGSLRTALRDIKDVIST